MAKRRKGKEINNRRKQKLLFALTFVQDYGKIALSMGKLCQDGGESFAAAVCAYRQRKEL
jgi:hypothetical protein